MTGDVFKDNILRAIPYLRAFARSLTRDRDRADDLVQEALLAAWEHKDSLRDVAKLRPWLLVILKNCFHASLRAGRREVNDEEGKLALQQAVLPEQTSSCLFKDVMSALNRLPEDHREVLVLIYVQQLTYEEASAIAGCPVGTIKSRLSRARNALLQLLDFDQQEMLQSDSLMFAAAFTSMSTHGH